MPMNRVQFQKGLSMPEFLERYGTEERCEQALIAARWPSGFVCPACGVTQARTTFRRQGRLYYQCAGCQHQCSGTSGTVFDSTKLPLTRWFLAMQFLTQSKNNVAALELKRQIGVCYRTAWLIKHKLLEAMRLVEADRQLTGRVEIDDAYLGGQRSGGKTGRGSENKVPFVAAVQTTDRGLRWAGLLRGGRQPGRLPRPHRHRRGQGQRRAGAVPLRQHAHQQHQDGAEWHLSLGEVCQVRLPLPGRGAVPIQSALQPARNPRQPGPRDGGGAAVAKPWDSGC
jgi:ribosomal protein L37AE/L43A